MMSTTASHRQQPSSHVQLGFHSDTYDPDDVGPRDSPPMIVMHPKLEPSPSPPPDIPLSQVSPSPPYLSSDARSNRLKIRQNSGDAILVASLDGGRHHDIANPGGFNNALGCDDDESPDDKSSLGAPPSDSVRRASQQGPPVHNLQHLAAGALEVALASGPRPICKAGHDISVSTRQLSLNDDPPPRPGSHNAYPARNSYPSTVPELTRHPIPIQNSNSKALPPLRVPGDLLRTEVNGHQLPSIRSQLGDITHLPADGLGHVEKELTLRRGSMALPRSPPTAGGIPRLLPMVPTVSPPTSPNGGYARTYSLSSPHSLTASSPFYYHGMPGRPSIDYSSSTAGETPSTEQSVSTPGTSTSVADRMSIDGITNPQNSGGYICKYTGCTAAAFQTQYLLNSHANVHSSARPHYCPVQGCPRSEGGKGFKRKNEMIRHGLVHDSPGYVCPFCPDREHKYPRPDNLQRHVRVHHIEKDKDDPLLRDVLAQRPDGPNRGRRRRGPPS